MNQNTNVNLIPKFPFSGNLYFSQYDVGRVATINLVEDGSAYTIPSGATVKIQATKPSGLGFSVECSYSGNVVTVVSTETMTDEYGRFPCELRIESGDILLGTTNFTFNVEKSPHPDGTTDGDTESVVSEITLALQNALTDIQAEGVTQKGLVTSEGTTQVGNVQAKGIEVLDSIPSDYTELSGDVEDLKSDVTTLEDSIVELVKSENLYIGSYTDNKNLLADGSEEDNTTRCVIEPFEVKANTTYYFYYNQYQERAMFVRCLQYDANMNLLSALTTINSQSVVTGSDTKYLRFGINKTFVDNYFSIVTYSTQSEAYAKYEPYFEPYYRLLIQPTIDKISDYIINVSNNTLYTEQAYIKNRVLICNNDHVNTQNTVAKYVKADMGSLVKKVMAKFTTRGGTVTLVSSPLSTDNNVQDIVNKSVHAVFDVNACTVVLFDNGASRSIGHFNYGNALVANDSNEYECGFEFTGANELTVFLPDGTTSVITDSEIDSHNGNYVIYEFYNNNVSSSDVPTPYFSRPSFKGFYCKCENGRTLRDDFQREDGALTVAPSGHTYISFRNQSSVDSIYSNTNGTNN